jgi:excinuclease ABC subunit B
MAGRERSGGERDGASPPPAPCRARRATARTSRSRGEMGPHNWGNGEGVPQSFATRARKPTLDEMGPSTTAEARYKSATGNRRRWRRG